MGKPGVLIQSSEGGDSAVLRFNYQHQKVTWRYMKTGLYCATDNAQVNARLEDNFDSKRSRMQMRIPASKRHFKTKVPNNI